MGTRMSCADVHESTHVSFIAHIISVMSEKACYLLYVKRFIIIINIQLGQTD